MVNYVDRFKRDILQQCPYPMEEEYKCLLFWRGVPTPVRQYVYLRQDNYYHIRSAVIYVEGLMLRNRLQGDGR